MIQYFQLTPEILLEYIYEGDPKLNEDGIDGNLKDISDKDNNTLLLKSDAFSTYYLCFENKFIDSENKIERLDSLSNLVLPLNNTETQFVIAKNKYQNFYNKTNASNRYSTKTSSGYMYEDTDYDKDIINAGNSCDVKFDKCIVHFTSRNYFGNYDSLIFQAYVYLKNKSKLYLASFLFKRTADLELKAEHLLYNEKLYTTQIEFEIPSVSAIFDNYNVDFNNALLNNQKITLLENTPIGINIYGVNGNIEGTDNYVRLTTRKINNISIPHVWNRLDEISVKISEAEDGDFYYIDPEISGYTSLDEYIKRMGEDIRSYVIMHELRLKEYWVDSGNNIHTEFTHKEHHIIDINELDEDYEISEKFDAKIKYRPICIHASKGCKATIIDTIKIINTVDGSSYEVTGELDIVNPNKYGKKIKKLNFESGVRPIVNVYNKKNTNSRSKYGVGNGNVGSLGGSISAGSTGNNGFDGESVIVLNKGGGFIVENNSQNITSFIECTNVGVSIMEISPDDIY